MNWKKRHWILNLLILLTLLVCTLAFVVHYKNWTRIGEDRFEILSGIYYLELPYSEIDSVRMVAHIPSMERINGFSAWMREKGVFKDSLRAGNKVRVYVDDLAYPKIKVVHSDSLVLYLNFTDTLETNRIYNFLTAKMIDRNNVKP